MTRFEKHFRLVEGDTSGDDQLALLGSLLVQGWCPRVDELDHHLPEPARYYWVASCLLEGTEITLKADRTTLEASLLVDTNPLLKPHQDSPWWVWPFLIACLIFGAAIWIYTGSVLLGLGAALGPVVVEIAWEGFVLDPRRNSAREKLPLDSGAWEHKLEQALTSISSPPTEPCA